MIEQYFGYIVLIVIALGLASSLTIVGILLGPKVRSQTKSVPFESGLAYKPVSKNIKVSFYLAAMIFLIFDVEVAFLYPYALKIKEFGWQGFYVIGIFIMFLALGILYEWKKNILDND